MEWITPKTDWTANDRFNISDFNRIKNNLTIIIGLISSLYESIEAEEMGEDITSYESYFDVDAFNAIEANVMAVSEFIEGVTPTRQTFYPNGKFIGYAELNRIEGIMARLNDQVTGWLAGLMRLPLTVGRDRRLPF